LWTPLAASPPWRKASRRARCRPARRVRAADARARHEKAVDNCARGHRDRRPAETLVETDEPRESEPGDRGVRDPADTRVGAAGTRKDRPTRSRRGPQPRARDRGGIQLRETRRRDPAQPTTQASMPMRPPPVRATDCSEAVNQTRKLVSEAKVLRAARRSRCAASQTSTRTIPIATSAPSAAARSHVTRGNQGENRNSRMNKPRTSKRRSTRIVPDDSATLVPL
jgi:hypothetical protein